jgi:hypothetical protein
LTEEVSILGNELKKSLEALKQRSVTIESDLSDESNSRAEMDNRMDKFD